MLHMLFGLTFVLWASTHDTHGLVCDTTNNWRLYGEHCFKKYDSSVSWEEANSTCASSSDRSLAIIKDNHTNAFIRSQIAGDSDVCIGLKILPFFAHASWTWSDGSMFVRYKDFDVHYESPHTCVLSRYGDWFSTERCYREFPFVCEKEATSNGSCDGWEPRYTYSGNNTHCYFMNAQEMNNIAAAQYCYNEGAYLVSINDESENNFLGKHIVNRDATRFWIGLSPFQWMDGSPYQWNNWDVDGKDAHDQCVYMNAMSGRWSSQSCGDRLKFICQEGAMMPTTTLDIPTTFISKTTTSISEVGETNAADASIDVSPATVTSSLESETNVAANALKMTEDGTVDTIVYVAVIGTLAAMVMGLVILVVCVCVYFKRRLSTLNSTIEEPNVYYNEAKQQKIDYTVSKDSKTKLDQLNTVPTTAQNTYEQFSQDPYVNSKQVLAGEYASLR